MAKIVETGAGEVLDSRHHDRELVREAARLHWRAVKARADERIRRLSDTELQKLLGLFASPAAQLVEGERRQFNRASLPALWRLETQPGLRLL